MRNNKTKTHTYTGSLVSFTTHVIKKEKEKKNRCKKQKKQNWAETNFDQTYVSISGAIMLD